MTDRAPQGPGDLDAAIAHFQAGRMEEAEAIFRRILLAAPGDVDALHLLGLVALQKGEAQAAVKLIEKAITLNPGIAPFHNSLGNSLKAQGDLDGAIKRFREALDLDPTLTGIHVNLGDALRAQGNLEEAEEEYSAVPPTDPQHFEALKKLGAIFKAQDRPNDAVLAFHKALEINADDAEIHNSLGATLLSLEHIQDAIIHFQRAIDIDPNYPQAHNNLGGAWRKQDDTDKAVDCFLTAILLDSEFALAHDNLGLSYTRLGKWEDAFACFQRALGINPDLPQVYVNLGYLQRLIGKHDEARSSYLRALSLEPENLLAKTNLAFLLLLVGDFAQAWHFYVSRPSAQNYSQELWQDALPKDLTGKHLLISKDQGLGDEIFFLRFAPEIKRRGANITYVTDPRLIPILAPLPFLDEVVDQAETNSGADYTLLCPDLPLACGMTSREQIPPPYPIPIDNQRQSKMSQRLKGLGSPPYIGITWRAGMPSLDLNVREISIDAIGKILKPVNGTFLALQRLPEAEEINQLADLVGRPVHDFTALNDDLEDMLALLSLMDEYVAIDNTNVHLRAGTGRTSRVLVVNPPDFRWMSQGTESPWFPGVRIYRQRIDKSWDTALKDLSHDLAFLVGEKH